MHTHLQVNNQKISLVNVAIYTHISDYNWWNSDYSDYIFIIANYIIFCAFNRPP